jgi:hypothetical protein
MNLSGSFVLSLQMNESARQAPWRQPVDDRQMEEASLGLRRAHGPKEPRSTVLTIEEDAIIVAFRRHTLCRSMIASTPCRRRSHI